MIERKENTNFTMVEEKKNEVDVYRDTPVRYLGYANEVGEAFKSIVPKSFVWASYGIAVTYVLADTGDKAIKVYHADTTPQRGKNVTTSMLDTFTWQMFASVIIPGFTINRICFGVGLFQKKLPSPLLRNKWLPTIVGLSCIPLIIHPIDNFVELAMNTTFRKWFNQRAL